MKKVLLAFILSFCICSLFAQEINIIPKPASLVTGTGNFEINSRVTIISHQSEAEKSISFFNDYLKKYYGFQLSYAQKNLYAEDKIFLFYDSTNHLPANSYKLTVASDHTTIEAHDAAGIFYGIQSLIQLLPTTVSTSLNVPCVTIIDSPRFAYRGLHLDCGRHFFSVDFIKQYIDFIALHKMNTFHWHLTEDQGWRIEIKKYPLLTQVGACRNGTAVGNADEQTTATDGIKYCGYYTQEQIKDVVKYAADRYITVIPEIEMPGHASAAVTAYPQLSCFPDSPKHVITTWGVFNDVLCPGDYTFNFLENVLDEVMQLFPSKYIHIGGDECPKDYWKKSAFCQKLMKDSGLKNEEELQSYFMRKIERYVNSKGRAIIGWDEILEGGIAPNATIMSWREEKGGIAAAEQHHNVMMTPDNYVYFDHAQLKKEDSITQGGFLPLKKVYNYDPLSKKFTADQAQYVLGAQANMWSEYLANESKLEYMLFPRLSALSEVLWSEPENKNWDDFKKRMAEQFKRYDLWKVNYCKKGFDEDE
jgi:hexosaminidase